jgi:hypothetical protein
MDKRGLSFGAAVTGLALLAGCSGGGPSDAGDSGIDRDSGPEVCADAGYCSVCHLMTACGEYPPGPYGMTGPSQDADGGDLPGMVLPPCFTAQGTWNPTGIWLFDGGNPQFASNEPLFQDLFCAGQAHPAATYALVQVAITDRLGNSMASDLSQCIDGPNEHWLSLGGQVMQIIEQSDMGLPPTENDLTVWVSYNETNYSIGADTNQVLQDLIHPGPMGLPVTFIVNLKTMQIMGAKSYGMDFGALQVDFNNVLDGGTF